MYVDVKVTTWERMKIPKDLENEVVNMLKDGYSVMDVIYKYDELNTEPLDVELHELSVEENGGAPTIEIFDTEKIEKIWDNTEIVD